MSSSTKIINVLKDDSFAEILNLFKTTPSGEVIFVLPKRSKAFQKEEHFTVLREAADDIHKTVSFLSSNPEANDLAEKHGFDVLLARAPVKSTSPRKTKVAAAPAMKAPIDVVNEIESFYDQPLTKPAEVEADEVDEDTNDEELEPVAAPAVSRRMAEVVHAPKAEQRSVKVNVIKEKATPIEVRNEPDEIEETAVEDDEEVQEAWQPEPIMDRKPSVAKRSIFSQARAIARPAVSGKRRLGYTLGSAAIIVAAAFIYWKTGSAQVTISPASTPLNFQLTSAASEAVSAVDTSTLTIPGQTFTIKKSVSQTFNATGSKDVAQKARGVVTVSNKTSSSQTLIATTRFEASDGHIFHSLTTITVPAGGTVDAQVIADKIGPDFDVPAGNFTVPAFKEKNDTARYQGITGKSTAAMHGGTSGKATVVTQDDFNKAKDALTTQLKQVVSDETKAETDGLKVVNDSAVSIDTPSSTAGVDDAADTFTMTLTGTLKTEGFKESDFNSLVTSYVDNKYHLDVVVDKLTMDFKDVNFDSSNNVLHMVVGINGPGYAKVNQDKILTDLLGKKQSQIETYLKALPGITSANVLLSPIWVRSVPKDSTKVHITVTR